MDKVTNQLKKTILKLVFSYGGIDEEIDTEIDQLKLKLRNSAGEDDRRKIIDSSVDRILSHSKKLRSAMTPAGKPKNDPLRQLMDKLSLPGDANDEILKLRQQVDQIKEEQEYLALIDKTVAVINSLPNTTSENDHHLIHLMEQLVLPVRATASLGKIRDQLTTGQYSSLKDINMKLSGVINDANARLQKELDDIRRYLNRLLGQLSVLYGHLQSTQREQGLSCMEAETLNEGFKQHVDEIRHEMEEADDLDTLRSSIDEHMARIEISLNEHLESERQRKQACEERVTDLKRRLEQMENESLSLKEKLNQEHSNAHRDVLTGIPNRLSYEEQLKKEFARCRRYQKPLALAVIDIDNFKKINDRYGHKAGDKVLKAVATVCKENIRDADFLARYGGEEFVLILPETDMEEAATAVENLRRVVESCNFYHQNQSVPVTVSVGYAEFRRSDEPDVVFHRADMALYSAKGNGRNCCISDVEIESAA